MEDLAQRNGFRWMRSVGRLQLKKRPFHQDYGETGAEAEISYNPKRLTTSQLT